MKSFVSRKTFIGKMIVSQLILSMLSIMLSMSCGSVTGVIPALSYIVSFLALGFYLYYFYTAFWQQGEHDVYARVGKKATSPLTAALLSFLALLPSFVVSVLCFVFSLIPSLKAAFAIGGMVNYLFHGMYCGVTACDGIYGSYYWHEDVRWLYLAVLLPGFLAGFWGYFFGARGVRIGSVFGIEPPQDNRN